MTQRQAKARILVVEDETDIRELLEIVLTSKGYAVTTAENGRAGLDILEGAGPDLVLLDLAMPGLDGLGFLQAKRDMAGVRDIPVIVLSARDRNNDGARAVEMGASAFMTKPFDTGMMLAGVARLLAGGHGAAG